MRSFRIPVLFSLILHLFIIGLLGYALRPFSRPSPAPESLYVFIAERRQSVTPDRVASQRKMATQETGRTDRIKNSGIPPAPESQKKTEESVPDPAWTAFLEQGEARMTILRKPVDSEKPPRSPGAFPEPTMGPVRLNDRVFPATDPVGDAIRRRNTGSQPLLIGLTPPAEETEENIVHPISLDFIPTRTQLLCLAGLFESDSLSDTQLYPLLGMDENVTYETYLQNIAELVQKGLISRTRISPRQIFSLFGVPIEMNPKNRRNPEFLYKPRIDKKTLLIFLDARLYGTREQLSQNPSDSIRIREQIRDLKGKLMHLRTVND
ncbi:MAG TPA: hypothetical protein ENN17_00980 [bacterium]|nr:hypothetical protein [bacterium]